jgi:hypothetical protein
MPFSRSWAAMKRPTMNDHRAFAVGRAARRRDAWRSGASGGERCEAEREASDGKHSEAKCGDAQRGTARRRGARPVMGGAAMRNGARP